MRGAQPAALVALAFVLVAACDDSTGPTPTPASVTPVSPTALSGRVGEAADVAPTVRVTDRDGEPIGGVDVVWTTTGGSVDPATAITDENGQAGALWRLSTVAGTDTARATVDSLVVEFVAVVQPGPAATLALSPASVTLDALGATLALNAAAGDAYGNVVAAAVEWSSSDTTVVRVTASGWIEAVAEGMAAVVGTAGELADTVSVTVEQVPARLRVIPSAVLLSGTGAEAALTATIEDRLGNHIGAAPTPEWTSGNPAVATASTEGHVTSTGHGQTPIVVTAGGLRGYAVVTVGVAGGSAVESWDTVWVTTLVDEFGHHPALLDMWGSAPDDIYAVGQEGMIVHYDGVSWSTMDSGTDADLLEVWGAGPGVVYASGEGVLLRLEHGAWTPSVHQTDGLTVQWGFGEDALVASGSGGLHVLRDGEWHTTPLAEPEGFAAFSPGVYAVWGFGPEDIYAVGPANGLEACYSCWWEHYAFVAHYDGDTWDIQVVTHGGYSAIAGMDPATLIAVGFQPGGQTTMARVEGGVWTSFDPGVPYDGMSLDAIWALGPDEIFVGGRSDFLLRYDGAAWHSSTSPGGWEGITAIWGSAAGPVWVGTGGGMILRGNR